MLNSSFKSAKIFNNSYAVLAGYDAYAFPVVGVFYVSTNGGSSWISRSAGLDEPVYGMSFINENTGILAGYEGNIYKTTNAGLNWINGGLTGTSNFFGDVKLISNDSVILVGGGGNILASFNAIVGVNNGSPAVISSDFHISQNYPNPFNPSTRINFSIPYPSGSEQTLVKLIIYDVLGREVTVLLNENLNAGNYEVTWDGTNYPSGVYYYKLQAGNYSETKKMVLLK